MDLNGIAMIMNSGGGWGILLGFLITASVGAGTVLKFYFEVRKDRRERDERYQKRDEEKAEKAENRHHEGIQALTSLKTAVEGLSGRLDLNDRLTSINVDHIIELAEEMDKNNGTEKRFKFSKAYLKRAEKQNNQDGA